jgi:hypothetical protein
MVADSRGGAEKPPERLIALRTIPWMPPWRRGLHAATQQRVCALSARLRDPAFTLRSPPGTGMFAYSVSIVVLAFACGLGATPGAAVLARLRGIIGARLASGAALAADVIILDGGNGPRVAWR